MSFIAQWSQAHATLAEGDPERDVRIARATAVYALPVWGLHRLTRWLDQPAGTPVPAPAPVPASEVAHRPAPLT